MGGKYLDGNQRLRERLPQLQSAYRCEIICIRPDEIGPAPHKPAALAVRGLAVGPEGYLGGFNGSFGVFAVQVRNLPNFCIVRWICRVKGELIFFILLFIILG